MSPLDVTIELAGAGHRAALSAFFAHHSAGCFCRFWHFPGDDNAWLARLGQAPDENRAAFEGALEAGALEAQGLVAWHERAVVGWLKLCPAALLPKLVTRRPYRGVSCLLAGPSDARAGVLTVSCALVAPALRRRGVFAALVQAAIAHATRSGARALEALPRRAADPLREDELWMGCAAVYERLGFVPVGGHDSYPVLQLELGAVETAP